MQFVSDAIIVSDAIVFPTRPNPDPSQNSRRRVGFFLWREDRRRSFDRDDLNPHRSPACRQIKPHLQVNVEVFAPCPSFKPGSMWVSRIFPPHSAQVARGTAG